MQLSEVYALLTHEAAKSPDPSTQNAACLLDENWEPIVFAHNDFPEGIRVSPERLVDRDTKMRCIEHAERNCIYEAARLGYSPSNLAMVTLWATCCDCARSIIQTGIKSLIHLDATHKATPDRWIKDVSTGLYLLVEAGVSIIRYSGEVGVGAAPFRFNGQRVEL